MLDPPFPQLVSYVRTIYHILSFRTVKTTFSVPSYPVARPTFPCLDVGPTFPKLFSYVRTIFQMLNFPAITPTFSVPSFPGARTTYCTFSMSIFPDGRPLPKPSIPNIRPTIGLPVLYQVFFMLGLTLQRLSRMLCLTFHA
jgi:hypothetical protein